ncbi:fumarate reductase/succinate dehydrogenase flavoprotein domain protein [Methanohalobium evestigatum Z-7303]|uniref:Fumarate reductase/succinate dehydrogenase flavoprotein domain protein n=1 Tax=Methanohalobium evestigatum (strain ATCC BAA-1072 / DSM 3721 / NBRC 107634 / OCM 161 / Z-7303) TaxID=644295 RepID=D7EB52_METEZ|nr:NAD(P)/FAD-dependent oxidoreductase [Methanohalobium evestigatum]ADI74569.1 fumarate reductase/succinate dehydrogenase flavoprotein domain protein [Methanohalobium evestigatum Z-7303]
MNADVLVIGASPAGLMAARNASSGGADVKLLDKKPEIGTSTHPANTFFKSMIDKTGEEVDQSYVIKKLNGAHIISPSGNYVSVKSAGFFIDRSKFDTYYAEQVRNTGVDIRTDVEAYNVIKSGDFFVVSTSQGTFRAKVVVVADGIKSYIARLLGLNPVKYPDDIAWAMEAEIESEGIGKPDMFEYYLGNVAPGWKSTYSPCGGNRATLGVYVRRHGRDVSGFFNNWVENFKKSKGLNDLKILDTKTGGDPIACIPDEIVSDGIMVVGGAAGQSGIGYGMRAGQIAGDVAAEALSKNDVSKSVLSQYRKIWNKEFRAEYYLGRIALETLRKMNDDEIDDMMKSFEGKDLSFIKGNPLNQAMQIGMYLLRNNPKSLLSYRALLRNR